MVNENKLILITGTDSGIGKALAWSFASRGYHVLATYLEKPGVDSASNMRLDLKSDADIATVSGRVRELVAAGKSLVCLVNNAGIALGGTIENIPIQLYRENFEVNLFGLISMTQNMIPHIIESKGKIILNGSSAGRTAAPFLSPYVCTKFALVGFADCLRRELNPYGIKTVLLETGGVATPIWDGFARQDVSFIDKKYSKSMELFDKNFLRSPKGLTAEEAAGKIMKVFDDPNPRPRVIIAKSPIRERIIRALPSRMLDSIFAKMFEMDYGKK